MRGLKELRQEKSPMRSSSGPCAPGLRVGAFVLAFMALVSCDGYLTELPTSEVPATITGFALAPSVVDLTFAPGDVTAEVRIRDAESVDSVRVELKGPNGTVLSCRASAPAEGNRSSGVWRCPWSVGSGEDPGYWTVESLSAFDGQGPAIEVSGSDLGEAGFPTTVSLTAVDRILVDPPTLTLEFPGDTATLTAVVLNNLDERIVGALVEWSSSDPVVAAVDGSGQVVPVGGGTTTIQASIGDVAGAATLAVTVPIESVLVTPEEATIEGIGGEQEFTALPVGLDGLPQADVPVAWASSDETVAVVDGAGVALATGEGITTITAHAGEVTGHAQLLVVAPPPVLDRIEVVPSAAVLTSEGDTVRFIARGVDSEGSVMEGFEFQWSSTATEVANVDAGGLASAVGPGTAQIQARIAGESGLVGVGGLTVLIEEDPQVARVVVSPDTLVLTELGQIGVLVATALDEDDVAIEGLEVEWSSDTPLVAPVSSAGAVTAIAEGQAVVTATIEGVTGSALVLVDLEQPEPTSIEISPSSVEVERLAEVQFTATVFDQFGVEMPGAEITWSSSNGCRASVDPDGVVTTWVGGGATIRATAGAAQAAASIEVAPAPEGVPSRVAGEWRICWVTRGELAATAELAHTPGETEVTGTVTRPDGSTAELSSTSTWIDERLTLRWMERPGSQAPREVVVDRAFVLNRELLRGPMIDNVNVDAGEVFISRVAGGEPTLYRIEVTPDTLDLSGPGEMGQLTAAAFDDLDAPIEGIDFAWASSNPNVATVDAEGLVTSVDVGQAIVTATAQGVTGGSVIIVSAEPPPPLEPTTVMVSPDSVNAERLTEVQFTATVFDQFGDEMPEEEITWSSSHDCRASVDSDGLASIWMGGAVTIRAGAGGVQGTASVSIAPAPDGVPATVSGQWRICGAISGQPVGVAELTHTPGETGVTGTVTRPSGATYNLSVTSTWIDDQLTLRWAEPVPGGERSVAIDRAVVVNQELLTGPFIDQANLQSEEVYLSLIEGGQPPLDRIEVTPDSVELSGPGGTTQLTATGFDANDLPIDGLDFEWISSNPSIVAVDGDGLVTGVALGEASVIASAQGISGSAQIIVASTPPEPTSIVVDPAVAEVPRLTEQQFTATVLDQFGNEMPEVEVEWSSSSPCLASVDEAGLVSAWIGGAVSITATAGSLEASASLTIEAAAAGIPSTVQGLWRKCRAWDGRYLGDFDLTHTAGETEVTGTYTEPPPWDDNVFTLSSQSEWVADELTLIWYQWFQGGERMMWLNRATPLNQEVIFGTFNNRISGQIYDVYLTRYDGGG